MAALNKVLLIGNLGADPVVRTFSNGDKVATISLATTESYKNKDGEKVENTSWHRVEFRGGLAGIVEQYLKKGRSVYVEGRLRYRKYTDADNVEKYITEIRATQMQMLSGGSNGTYQSAGAVTTVAEDDGLPF